MPWGYHQDIEELAMAFFGGEDPDPPVPVRPYRAFDIPFLLLECAESIPNWNSVRDSLPTGWDEHKFRLVRKPCVWCEALAGGCDCHGTEDELSAAYWSDFGLAGDVEQRASKFPNVRYAENLKQWEERAAAMERNSGEQPPYRDAVIRLAESILPAEPDPDRLI